MFPLHSKIRLAVVTACAALGGAGMAWLVNAGFSPGVAAEATGGVGAAGAQAETKRGAAAIAPATAAGRLAEAAGEADFFRRAAKSFEAINKLTEADFAELAMGGTLPGIVGAEKDAGFRKVLAEALVRRWLAVDAEGAAEAVVTATRRSTERAQTPGERALREALAKVAPAAFLTVGAALPTAETGNGLEWPWPAALTALARSDPEAARRFGKGFPKDRTAAVNQAIALGIAASDPLAAIQSQNVVINFAEVLETALRTAERSGPGVLRALFESARGRLGNSDEIVALCARYPEFTTNYRPEPPVRQFNPLEPMAQASLRAALDELPAEELSRRLQAEEKIPANVRGMVLGELAEAWAMHEPAAATGWALARLAKQSGNEEATRQKSGGGAQENPDLLALEKTFAVWREKDEGGALAWLQAQPEFEGKTKLGNRAALAMAQRGDVAAALKLYSAEGDFIEDLTITVGNSRRRMQTNVTLYGGTLLAETAATQDPATAVQWAADLPNGSGFFETALGHWVERDPEGAGAWAEALPEGAKRDGAFASLAAAIAKRDPEGAGEWVDAMADPNLRDKAVREVAQRISRRDPVAGRAWSQARPSLTPEEKGNSTR